MGAGPTPHELREELTRRGFLARATIAGAGALVAAAAPLASGAPALAAEPSIADATLQAFADTIIPGRRVARTDLGNAVAAGAIAGVDDLPGAVEADALALFHHPEIGFDALEPAFLAELEAQALLQGSHFLALPFGRRVAACVAGLDFGNPLRLIWEAAAAVPFTAFCAAALIPNATARRASGYRVMGLPGIAPNGYRDFSYRRALSRERTHRGYLP
jgi:hypothetical protein